MQIVPEVKRVRFCSPFFHDYDHELLEIVLFGKMLQLTLLLLNTTRPVLANSVDPDQLASGSALFVIKYVNFYKNPDEVI